MQPAMLSMISLGAVDHKPHVAAAALGRVFTSADHVNFPVAYFSPNILEILSVFRSPCATYRGIFSRNLLSQRRPGVRDPTLKIIYLKYNDAQRAPRNKIKPSENRPSGPLLLSHCDLQRKGTCRCCSSFEYCYVMVYQKLKCH